MPQAQQLGRYHLLDRIAFGGMAEIFRAKTFDSKGQVHLVAVKRVLAHLVEDQDFLQMLVDEAKISALLRHENIARLYEFAKAGDEYFLAMEYIDGKDLRSVLERGRQTGRPVPPEHVAWVAMETAHALHAAHVQRDGAGRALRIVHRDVSPSNVLCSYHGEVKLCDFGIAKATLTRVQTKTGVIKGKVKYMSPEQAMGRKLDHRSDLFSLGTVMYEMLTLAAPFQAPTEIELIFAVRDARKTPVKDVTADCPDELVRIVDKAMTRSRAARYQSGEDLALDLRIFLDKQVPGYRRSNFSRYMRKVFEDEIERELRGMEAFEIQQADNNEMGVNLIAEALGPDAPFTKFTPMFASSTQLTNLGTSNFPHIQAIEPDDLHVQPTMMLDRAKLGLAPAETPLPAPAQPGDFAGTDSIVETQPSPKVELEEDPPIGDIHAEQTRILMAPVAPREERREEGRGDLHVQATMIIFNPIDAPAPGSQPVVSSRDLHEEDTGSKELPSGVSTVEGYRGQLADAPPEDSLLPTVPRGPSIHELDTGDMKKAEPAASTDPIPLVTSSALIEEKLGGQTDERFPVPPTMPTNPLHEAAVATPTPVEEKGGNTERRPPAPAVLQIASADLVEESPEPLEEEEETTGEEQTSVPLKDDDLEDT